MVGEEQYLKRDPIWSTWLDFAHLVSRAQKTTPEEETKQATEAADAIQRAMAVMKKVVDPERETEMGDDDGVGGARRMGPAAHGAPHPGQISALEKLLDELSDRHWHALSEGREEEAMALREEVLSVSHLLERAHLQDKTALRPKER
eukprot:CAMPEP_0184495510 /NCGR_PEP_ID=MMETSP0113_2-20130426/31537_1 /TAXON_ID=91329 /ORGANISM="Norrisiella sphaerica, Strain BC52" /LENGTH=146 /DNA_ID=CAMNT_0026881727 /DNA_START=165 /DNA_END=605 /DNA_ORIENTATION=-